MSDTLHHAPDPALDAQLAIIAGILAADAPAAPEDPNVAALFEVIRLLERGSQAYTRARQHGTPIAEARRIADGAIREAHALAHRHGLPLGQHAQRSITTRLAEG